jgi:PH (Pleckstrin Homology) domain-containing protein
MTTAALVIRPRRVRMITIPVAGALVVLFVVIAIVLQHDATGVFFGAGDRVALVLIGIALAAGALVFGRARVVADESGVEVRNLFFGQRVSWDLVRAVTFPDGAPWARLELPADEYIPVVAIQAFDGEHAVRAIRELRALHRKVTDATDQSDSDNAS